jgi:hypothetical protein
MIDWLIAQTAPNVGPLPHVQPTDATLQIVLTIIFTTTGAISLLIMTIAGFRYITSRGSPQDVGKSKNAIVYAVIGLLVSVSAGAIIKFVIGGIT